MPVNSIKRFMNSLGGRCFAWMSSAEKVKKITAKNNKRKGNAGRYQAAKRECNI